MKKFVAPELEVLEMQVEDIITTSGIFDEETERD